MTKGSRTVMEDDMAAIIDNKLAKANRERSGSAVSNLGGLGNNELVIAFF